MRTLRKIISMLLCIIMLPCVIVASAEEESFQWDVSKESLMASLLEADITSIHKAYEAGLITCTELTAYYLERIDAYNETYNCFITLCDDALEQAALADQKIAAGEEGALLGIPMVIKDNMDYAGYHTTNGHAKQENQIADSDAQVVSYLLREGAVIIGKTNMSTDAEDSRGSKSEAVGETKNAYNSQLASGGSSGGSAVATSLNFAVAGLGTDTNSSLRLPAVLNGCVALRITWGSLSMEGIVELIESRDVPGVITRSVRDQAIVLDVLSGGITNYADNLAAGVLDGLRIGVLKELSTAVSSDRSEDTIDKEVMAAFFNAIEEMKSCGAEVVEVSIPDILSYANRTYDGGDDEKAEMYELIQEAMADYGVSALIFPSYLHTPQRSGKDDSGTTWYTYQQTFINNTSLVSSCAGLPEIAIPIGYHSLGAGIGMEIAALKNQEQLLLDIAYAYSDQFNHRKAPIDALDIYADDRIGTLSQMVDRYYDDLASYEAANLQRIAEEQEKLKEEQEAAQRRKAWITAVVIVMTVILLLATYQAYCNFVRKRRRRRRRKHNLHTNARIKEKDRL